MDNKSLVYVEQSGGAFSVFRRAEVQKYERGSTNTFKFWVASITPLRNAAGLYEPSIGYLVSFNSFEAAVERATLEAAKLHVEAVHALTN